MDSYRTVAAPSEEVLFKEKNSKFFGYVFPVSDEIRVKPIIEQLRTLHPGASHFCYAWQIGTGDGRHRANDDGEPSGTAGLPIYGQIQRFGVTNVLVVVVRFFGGTKLGAGGLVSAYRSAAQLALEAASIVEKSIELRYRLSFSYADIEKVMRIVREKKIGIISQTLELDCVMEIAVAKARSNATLDAFKPLYNVTVSAIDPQATQ
jgi:uncharacterized YigZ family protein